MNSRRLSYLPCSFHPRGLEFARQPDAMKRAADTTLFAMHATAILQLSCSRVALLRDDRWSLQTMVRPFTLALRSDKDDLHNIQLLARDAAHNPARCTARA
jgi:hypothetical protein